MIQNIKSQVTRIRNLIPFKIKKSRTEAISMKEYESYESALANSHSYEDPEVIEVVSKKTQSFINSLSPDHIVSNRQTIQNMFVLQSVYRNKPVNVLELGGACGASYFELDHLLPYQIRNWFVVETPAMAAVGKRFFETDNKIKFFDDIHAAATKLEDRDCIIAQGVLQYLPDPLQGLDNLFRLGFTHVYVTRTQVGVGIEQPIITKQVHPLSAHEPGTMPECLKDRETSQPLTILPYESLIHAISGSGYKTLFVFDEGDGTLMIGQKKIITKMVGFMVTRDM